MRVTTVALKLLNCRNAILYFVFQSSLNKEIKPQITQIFTDENLLNGYHEFIEGDLQNGWC